MLYPNGGEPQSINAPYEVDDFFGEVSHFVGLVEAGIHESPLMSPMDSIACAAVLDVVRLGFRQP